MNSHKLKQAHAYGYGTCVEGGGDNVKHHRHDLLIVFAFSFTEQNYFLVSDILTKWTHT